MEKSETNIGKFLKENKAIFNYIYDSRGFRIGVILAKKGDYIGHNLIGWALFDEIEYPSWTQFIGIKDLPIYKDLINAVKESINRSVVKDSAFLKILEDSGLFKIYDAFNVFNKAMKDTSVFSEDGDRNVPAFYIVSKEDILEALKKALEKANYDSWNYYCLKHEEHDLRKDIVGIDDIDNYEQYRHGEELPILANNIRKAVRKMEFRACRYFK